MRIAKLLAGAALASLIVAPVAIGQTADPPAPKPDPQGMMQHQGHDMGMPGMDDGPDDPVTAALAAINRRMHREMAVPPSGNADRDFVAAMIPHHQGAIDMARLVLGFGSDPEVRKLAEAIIAAQAVEIAMMQAWLARQPN